MSWMQPGAYQNPYMQQQAWQQPAQMWPQAPMGQMAQPTPQPSQLVKVHGMEGARSFRMAPGETGVAFDDVEDVFYLLEADGAGSVRVTPFSFARMDAAAQPGAVTREEFDALAAKVEGLLPAKG